jgi:hypothetical protein
MFSIVAIPDAVTVKVLVLEQLFAFVSVTT